MYVNGVCEYIVKIKMNKSKMNKDCHYQDDNLKMSNKHIAIDLQIIGLYIDYIHLYIHSFIHIFIHSSAIDY